VDASFFVLQLEDLVRRAVKDAREDQRQLQAGHVAVALDGVDALPRDSRGLRKLLLRPPLRRAQLFYPIDNCRNHVKLTFHISIARVDIYVKLTRYYILDKPKST
jgi:hypothetical protein